MQFLNLIRMLLEQYNYLRDTHLTRFLFTKKKKYILLEFFTLYSLPILTPTPHPHLPSPSPAPVPPALTLHSKNVRDAVRAVRVDGRAAQVPRVRFLHVPDEQRSVGTNLGNRGGG